MVLPGDPSLDLDYPFLGAGSVEAARTLRSEVVALDLSRPFTAARACNEDLSRLSEIDPERVYVQFLGGNCELREGWIEVALAEIETDTIIAVACGRRGRFPDASLWNRLVDREWDTPMGETQACGGNALIRRAAIDSVGGYREDLIAGEEPEICLRMRKAGWRIYRIDGKMMLHDAATTNLGQWWQRARRARHAYAEGAALHPTSTSLGGGAAGNGTSRRLCHNPVDSDAPSSQQGSSGCTAAEAVGRRAGTGVLSDHRQTS